MSSTTTTTTATLTPLSSLEPPSQERTWQTTPHPRLPIAATCGADKSVRIYSLVNFRLLSTISGGHKRSVRACAWKPGVKGESVLATASFDSTVGIWRRWDGYGLDEGEKVFEARGENDENGNEEEDEEEWGFAVLLDGHDSEVKSVSWSASGSLLATCSRDKSIWIWEDLEDGDNNFETVAVLQEHNGDVKCVAWHPNEECLASGSYDDTIRIWREDIDDWGQVACLKGHEGTVWTVDWEAGDENKRVPRGPGAGKEVSEERRKQWLDRRSLCGPRLVSCSDDKTIRIWRKQARERNTTSSSATGIPSIIRAEGIDETWFEETQLPRKHDMSVYSVAWSKRTGLIASTGADGRIVVYQERFTADQASSAGPDEELPDAGAGATENNALNSSTENASQLQTEWRVVASIEGAHDIYEINHICWAKRADRAGKQEAMSIPQNGRDISGPAFDEGSDVEEILLSTGDDGTVRAWKLER